MSIVYDINIQKLAVGTKYDSDNEAAFYKTGNPNLQVDTSHGDHIKCVNHPDGKGKKALEFLVQKSPNSSSKETHKGRAELAPPYNLGPADMYVGLRIMFPSDFPAGARELIFFQGGNHGNPGTNPPVSCSINNDILSFEGGYSMPLVRNRWYAIEYRVKMSTSSSGGKFQLWVDGDLKVDKTQKTALTSSEDGADTYLWKTGMYAYNWRHAPDVGPDSYRYFVDHLKMATTRAEVAYSAPTPPTTAPTPPTTAPTPPTIAITTPANGSQLAVGQPTALKATAIIATGTITKVEFFVPTTPTTILGTDTSPTGSQYEVSYAFQSPGTKQIVAKAYGSNGITTQSSAFTYTAVTPAVPVVSMTTPADGATVYKGQPIVLKANASTTSGTITKVEFFVPTTPTTILGTDTSPTGSQYEVSYSFQSTGTKQIVAKAYGSNGITTQSSAFTYTAVTPDVTPPTVSMEPVQILVGEAIRLVASASDNVKVSKVEFFGTNAAGDISSGATPLTTGSVAPYQGSYAFTSAGTKYVVAVATDSTANKTKSAPISFNIYQ